MLFKPRGAQAQKEEKPKNQMTLADMLAFRDTWTDIPTPEFSVLRLLMEARLEKLKKSVVPKLVMSENGFRVRDKAEMDAEELELRRLQSALNKLTDKNFDAIAEEMMTEELVYDLSLLKGAVNIIFAKAVSEPVFASLYARLIARIASYEMEVAAKAEKDAELMKRLDATREILHNHMMQQHPNTKDSVTIGSFVRRVAVLRCQEFYESFSKQGIPESAEAEEHLRKQNMANTKFIGELYIKNVVPHRVVVIIASYALGVCWGLEATKTTASDADLELVYNLLMVIGPKFDAAVMAGIVDGIWEQIGKFSTDKAFSIRIRFLLQNLLELRANKWEKRETPLPTSSTATESAPKPSQPSQQRTMPRTSSMQHQDGSGGRRGPGNVESNPMAGARRNPRPTSFNDLRQADSGSGKYVNPTAPMPPAFNDASQPPPPPFPGAVPEMTEEEKKFLALAQPPPALTAEVEKKILSIMRDAHADQDWASAAADLATVVPGEQKPSCIMCAVYAATKKMCLSSSEDDRTTFGAALDNPTLIDPSSVARGYAWFLADAIANGYQEDAPRVFSRFVSRVVATKTLTFHVMLRDVIARSGNYLDALFIPLDGESGTWEEKFLEVWSSMLDQWIKARGGDAELKDTTKTLDCTAAANQRPFMRDIVPDFLLELSNRDLLPNDAVSKWIEANGKDERTKGFAKQLEQLLL